MIGKQVSCHSCQEKIIVQDDASIVVCTLCQTTIDVSDVERDTTSASSIEKDLKTSEKVNKTELSKIVAQKLAKKAKEKNITKIYFDRGSYKYHGRVKAFAETLRENGMEF